VSNLPQPPDSIPNSLLEFSQFPTVASLGVIKKNVSQKSRELGGAGRKRKEESEVFHIYIYFVAVSTAIVFVGRC